MSILTASNPLILALVLSLYLVSKESYRILKVKNVWKSDKSWEPGMFLQNLQNLQTCKLANLQNLQIDPLDMLNNFCFHVYAQKSLFLGENVNDFFWPHPQQHHPHLLH